MSRLPLKTLERACAVCGGTSGEVLHHQAFGLPDAHPLPAAYDVVACAGCGFVYADTPAPQAAYDRYYREYSKYEDASLATGGGLTKWEGQRYDQVADVLAPHLGFDQSLLDIGCANGGLLTHLRARGYARVAGADLAEACVAAVRAKGIPATLGGLLTSDAHDEPVDAIVLSHVLEHVRDLEAALSALKRRLRPGGLVYVEVPDAARYHAVEAVPFYFFDCEHINHFDEAALCALFARHGFAALAHGGKDIFGGENRPYPAAYGLFRFLGPTAFEPDGAEAPAPRASAARAAVLAHVAASQASGLDQTLAALADAGRPVIVWGAGSFALRLLEGALGRCNLVAWIDKDRNKLGQQLLNRPIHPPEFLLRAGHDGPLVICSALHGAQIEAEIRAMGLTNELIHLASLPAPLAASSFDEKALRP